MCIAALVRNAHPDYPFILLFNRDELFERPTAEPTRHESGAFYAKDERAGGTWMGVNAQTGAVAALTNVHCAASHDASAATSRGLLVRDLLESSADASAAKLSAAELSKYRAFTLLHGRLSPDGGGELSLSVSSPVDRGSGAFHPHTTRLPDGVHRSVFVFSNETRFDAGEGGGLNGSWPKCVWLRAEVMRLLEKAPEQLEGEAGASALLDLLMPAMSATRLPDDFASRAAETRPESSLPAECQAGPFLEPFLLPSDMGAASGQLYGTVSQSAVIVCSRAAFCVYAHRRTNSHSGQPAAGSWTCWHKEPLASDV